MVPPIRFKGFSEEWEKKELGEVLTERKVLQKISADAPILAFASGQGVIDRSERRSNNRDHLTRDQANKIYKLTEYDDIVYNPANLKYGAIDRNKHGRGVISPIYVTFITEEESSFIELIVKSEKFKLRALLYEEGTVVKRQSVKPENLLSLNIHITPNPEEQAQIGKLFQKIDQMIGLHQRKHEKLVTLKKAMLKKMFPQNGATTPEIRFKGFSEPWEEKPLGNIGEAYSGLSGKNKDDFGHGEGRFVTYMNVFSNAISDPKMTERVEIDKGQNEVKAGDVFFTISSETPDEVGMSSVWVNNTNNVYLNSFCFGFRPSIKNDSYYLAYMLRSNDFRWKVSFLAQGISRYNISKNKVMDISVSIPCLHEQQKIGNYFHQLDELVAQHGTQVKKLKQIKAAFLEKMFV